MRLVIFVLALAGCGEVRQVHRWPDHRRTKDEEISALTEKTRTLETRSESLETRVKQLEHLVDQLQHQPSVAPQPAAPALPSPGT